MMKKEEQNLTLEELIENKQEEVISSATGSELVSLIAISELTNTDKMKVVSRIKYEQVSLLTKLALFSQTFGIDFINDIADNILQLQVSINGYGRKELVSVVNQSISNVEQNQKNIKKRYI